MKLRFIFVVEALEHRFNATVAAVPGEVLLAQKVAPKLTSSVRWRWPSHSGPPRIALPGYACAARDRSSSKRFSS
jgi:hypothetical protein